MKKNQKYRYEQTENQDTQAWLMTYADMMTLLVCFFVLMMGISQIDFDSFEKIKKEVSTSFGGKYEDPYAKLSDSLEEVISVENLGKEIKLKSKGAGVTLVFQGQMLFDSGKASIKPEASNILSKITSIIKKEADDLFIVVEGHTDNVPISTLRFPSNWELSAGRAARIVREFENFGIKKEKMLAVGVGEVKPLKPNENPDGTPNFENRSINRRVVVRITKDELIKDTNKKINYKSEEYLKSIQGALK